MQTTRTEYKQFGTTSLNVSRICFGTWQAGGDWGSVDENEIVSAIRAAREVGINFFDTAQAYGFGASERLLGKALADAVSAIKTFAVKRGISVAQLAIAWTLANPAVDVAIVGVRNPTHVGELAGASRIALTPEDLREIDTTIAAAVAAGAPSSEGM